ncbi:MAG: hypothetical protein FJ098_05500 [Deltaproteobacteria bacterium]|nr:hypothetical protein [Deltaproteobacteria bacterium]
MDPETLIARLAGLLDGMEPPPPKGTVLGSLDGQVVLSTGAADTRAFVDILPEGFRVEAHAVVEMDGDAEGEILRQEAVAAMDEEVWPLLAGRGYQAAEEDWNDELCLLTRFAARSVVTVEELAAELYFLAGAELQQGFAAE